MIFCTRLNLVLLSRSVVDLKLVGAKEMSGPASRSLAFYEMPAKFSGMSRLFSKIYFQVMLPSAIRLRMVMVNFFKSVGIFTAFWLHRNTSNEHIDYMNRRSFGNKSCLLWFRSITKSGSKRSPSQL